jgi:hypothetical protein
VPFIYIPIDCSHSTPFIPIHRGVWWITVHAFAYATRVSFGRKFLRNHGPNCSLFSIVYSCRSQLRRNKLILESIFFFFCSPKMPSIRFDISASSKRKVTNHRRVDRTINLPADGRRGPQHCQPSSSFFHRHTFLCLPFPRSHIVTRISTCRPSPSPFTRPMTVPEFDLSPLPRARHTVSKPFFPLAHFHTHFNVLSRTATTHTSYDGSRIRSFTFATRLSHGPSRRNLPPSRRHMFPKRFLSSLLNPAPPIYSHVLIRSLNSVFNTHHKYFTCLIAFSPRHSRRRPFPWRSRHQYDRQSIVHSSPQALVHRPPVLLRSASRHLAAQCRSQRPCPQRTRPARHVPALRMPPPSQSSPTAMSPSVLGTTLISPKAQPPTHPPFAHRLFRVFIRFTRLSHQPATRVTRQSDGS